MASGITPSKRGHKRIGYFGETPLVKMRDLKNWRANRVRDNMVYPMVKTV